LDLNNVKVIVYLLKGTNGALLSDDAVAAFPEEVVLLVKLSVVLSDGHVEALLLKVGLLLLTDGGLLQHLRDTETSP